MSEYADGLKDAGYNSMRFLKAAVKEDLEEMANDIGMKKVHTKVFLAAWDELRRWGVVGSSTACLVTLHPHKARCAAEPRPAAAHLS